VAETPLLCLGIDRATALLLALNQSTHVQVKDALKTTDDGRHVGRRLLFQSALTSPALRAHVVGVRNVSR